MIGKCSPTELHTPQPLTRTLDRIPSAGTSPAHLFIKQNSGIVEIESSGRLVAAASLSPLLELPLSSGKQERQTQAQPSPRLELLLSMKGGRTLASHQAALEERCQLASSTALRICPSLAIYPQFWTIPTACLGLA